MAGGRGGGGRRPAISSKVAGGGVSSGRGPSVAAAGFNMAKVATVALHGRCLLLPLTGRVRWTGAGGRRRLSAKGSLAGGAGRQRCHGRGSPGAGGMTEGRRGGARRGMGLA